VLQTLPVRHQDWTVCKPLPAMALMQHSMQRVLPPAIVQAVTAKGAGQTEGGAWCPGRHTQHSRMARYGIGWQVRQMAHIGGRPSCSRVVP
jgi:hypothetical protein